MRRGRGSRTASLCRKMEIRHVTAMTGFTGNRYGYKPTTDGVVVSKRLAIKLLAALAERAAKKRPPVDPAKARAARQKRQERETTNFADEIRNEFPGMPADDVLDCAKQATKIGSGCVGRSSTVDEPVRLAVLAYARHEYTDYESCLGDRDEYYEIKREFNSQAGEIIDGWRQAGVMEGMVA